ncbi:hypothetical protein BC833DRAFT_610551 [Globomyces pollinis-pini]|nr:hypothetical protein BC833DRAFT_610551 [Globomyces pollinis-pini]
MPNNTILIIDLPTAILEAISNHLTIGDYHSFRLCSEKINLPKLPILTWEVYTQSVADILPADYSKIPKLCEPRFDTINNLTIEMIYHHQHYQLIENYLLLFHKKINRNIIYNLFFHSCIEGKVNIIDVILKIPDFRVSEEDHYKTRLESLIKYGFNQEKFQAHLKYYIEKKVCQENDGLFFASFFNHLECVKTILNDPRLLASNLDRCIWIVIETNAVDILKLLFSDSRFQPNAADNLAVRLAVQNNHSQCLKLLLNRSDVDPGAFNNLAIQIVALNGYNDCLILLLADSRVDPTILENSPIRLASERGHTKTLRILLNDSRVNPSADHNLSIRVAAENGHLECIKLLLDDSRINLEVCGSYSIISAASFGHSECLRLLLADQRLDPTIDQNAALRAALDKHQMDCVNLLQSDVRVLNFNRINI